MLHSVDTLIPFNKFNRAAKIFITSETLFWTAWNTLLPVLSVFLLANIPGASITTVTTGFSTYVLFRVIGSLASGKMFCKSDDTTKLYAIIFGITLLNISYFGFIFIKSIAMIYVLYLIIGLGCGFATPIRASFFSKHLDRSEETEDWAVLDSSILFFTAIASLLSGFVITLFGFQTLFAIVMVLNLLSVIPYVYYLKTIQPTK